MRLALVLSLLSGAYSAAVWGPGEVRGLVGDSLTVPCSYTAEYESNVKYWCKGSLLCDVLVKTDGTNNDKRLSINDNKIKREFSVTMKDLREEDDGWYQCGISVPGAFLLQSNETSPVYISVKKVKAQERMISQTKGSVTVPCKYHSSYTNHEKYWCKGYSFLCSTLVKTSASNTHRISISDNKIQKAFYITMKGLTKDDEGSYMCGISKSGFDEKALVYIQVNEGVNTPYLRGPVNVTAQASSSTIIRCWYSKDYTNSVKYWCKKAGVDECSSELNTENRETEDRTWIRDDRPKKEFQITIRSLTVQDTGWYFCGVKASHSRSDERASVHLYVHADNSNILTTTKPKAESIPTSTPENSEGKSISTKKQGETSLANHLTAGGPLPLWSTLTIATGALLLLFCVAAVIAWKIKRKITPAVEDKGEKPPEANDLTYAEVLINHRPQEPSDGLYANVKFHQRAQRPSPRDQVVYSAMIYRNDQR